MNAIYKVIWNDALRLYQVVNEMCRSRRKACSVKAVHMEGSGRTLKRSVLATAAAVTMMAGGGAFAMDLPGMVIDLGGGRVTTELQLTRWLTFHLRENRLKSISESLLSQDWTRTFSIRMRQIERSAFSGLTEAGLLRTVCK